MDYERFRRFLASTGIATLGILLVALVTLEFVQVILRYGFDRGLFWASDATTLLLSSLGWLGIGVLWLDRSHLCVDILGERFSSMATVVTLGADVLTLTGVIWLFPKIMATMHAYNQLVMPSLNVPASIRFIPSLLGLGLVAAAALLDIVQRLRTRSDSHRCRDVSRTKDK